MIIGEVAGQDLGVLEFSASFGYGRLVMPDELSHAGGCSKVGAGQSRATLADRPKLLAAAVLVGHGCVVIIGSAWWVANLGTMPAYGDTSQYFHLASTLRVDQYRTLFYPLLLRGLQGIAWALAARIELLVYLLQTGAALLSVGYLAGVLWDVTASTLRFAFLTGASPTVRRLVIGALAVAVFTEPLVNHFALSVLTDSLATSFTTAGVAALVRIAVLADTRLRTGVLGWLTIVAAGFMRAEKVPVFAVVIAVTLAILAARDRCEIPLGSEPPRRRRLAVLALLATLLLTPSATVLVLNRAMQTADYGWPPLSPSVRLFVRTAWPRLADIRPLLSAEAQAVISAADADRFDSNYNEYLSLVPRLRRSAGGTDRLVNDVSLTALRHRGIDVAVWTAVDAIRYTAPMIAYPLDLVTDAHSASGWTDSRMGMVHPTLTHVYLVIATTVLVAVQLPLLFVALIGREGDNPRVAYAAGLIVGTAVVNGVLYAMGNGLQNVRYALPAYVLVHALIVWAGAVWLAIAWRRSGTARFGL